MNPTDCDRTGCDIGGKRVSYADLRHYVCEECGGAIVHRIVRVDGETVDEVACGSCGSVDIISESKYLQQISEGYEVLRSLPPDLRALLEPEREQVNAEQAIADLFG